MSQRLATGRAVADASGTAVVEFQTRGSVDWVVLLVNVSARMPNPASKTQAAIVATMNGNQIDSTSSGNQDVSPQRNPMSSGDTYAFTFTGCDVGAVCVVTLSGVAYPYGQGPRE